MTAPLLTTKPHVPVPRTDAVPRPRLFELLDRGLARKLTLIAAPAGFGKTTLIAAWLAEKAKGKRQKVKEANDDLLPFTFSLLPSNMAWLSLDDDDNDPVRLLTYLIAAVQTIDP